MKPLWWIAVIFAVAPVAAQTDPSLGLPSPAAPVTEPDDTLTQITITATEPRYAASTMRDRIGRIWAPVYLDGKGPFRLVLDTGANRSAITAKVVDALGDSAGSASKATVRGVTGSAVVPTIRVKELTVGDLLIAPARLPVVLDVFGGADGVLGNDGLLDKRIVIDFRHDSISIKRSRREQPGVGYNTLPISFARDHLPVVDARVGRIPVKAIIDTGAPDSLANMALLNALRQTIGDTTDTEIQGVTLDVEHGRRARMPTIYLQNLQVRGASLSFGDVYIFEHWRMTREPTIMLGMDVLGVMQQIIIDFKTQQLHLLAGNSQP